MSAARDQAPALCHTRQPKPTSYGRAPPCTLGFCECKTPWEQNKSPSHLQSNITMAENKWKPPGDDEEDDEEVDETVGSAMALRLVRQLH